MKAISPTRIDSNAEPSNQIIYADCTNLLSVSFLFVSNRPKGSRLGIQSVKAQIKKQYAKVIFSEYSLILKLIPKYTLNHDSLNMYRIY